MKQMSLANTGFELSSKRTRKRAFLDELNLVVPWRELVALIEPHAPVARTGRPAFALLTMLRIHFMQQWFGMPIGSESINRPEHNLFSFTV